MCWLEITLSPARDQAVADAAGESVSTAKKVLAPTTISVNIFSTGHSKSLSQPLGSMSIIIPSLFSTNPVYMFGKLGKRSAVCVLASKSSVVCVFVVDKRAYMLLLVFNRSGQAQYTAASEWRPLAEGRRPCCQFRDKHQDPGKAGVHCGHCNLRLEPSLDASPRPSKTSSMISMASCVRCDIGMIFTHPRYAFTEIAEQEYVSLTCPRLFSLNSFNVESNREISVTTFETEHRNI